MQAAQLFQILDAYKTALQQAFKGAGVSLSPLYYRVLTLVDSGVASSPQQLAAISGRDKAQISRLVNELVSAGLVTKQAHPLDKRSVCLALTPDASHLLKAAKAQTAALDAILLQGLDADEQQQLQALLQRLLQNLQTTQQLQD